MKKELITILTIILLIIGITFSVNAADATVTLTPSKSELNPGDTFTVTISATCEDGINGLIGTVTYDKDKLQLVESKVTNDNWYNAGESTDDNIVMEIIGNSRDKITTADIFRLTFKVKEDAQVGTTAKVTASNIQLDSDAETESLKELGTKEVTVSIVEKQTTPPTTKTLSSIEITKAPNKTKYNAGEKFDTTGMKVTAKYSDGTSKEVTSYTYSPNVALKTSDTKVTVSYTEGGVTKTAEQKITVAGVTSVKEDETQAKKDIPYTGAQNYIVIIAIVVGIIAIGSYIKLKQYKNI